MKNYAAGKLLTVIGLIGLCTLYGTMSQAATIADGFDGAVINSQWWSPFAESQSVQVFQQEGELHVKINGGSVNSGAGVNSKFRLKGDFDATVDYRLISWPPTNGVRLGFEGGPNDKGFMVKRISFGPEEPQIEKEVYFTSFLDNSQWSGNMLPTADTRGSLRLTRVGEVLTGYFKQNGDWQLIASHDFSPLGFIELVDICLWAIGDPPEGQNVEIAFDNFQVNYDQVKMISYQTPLNTLLLD